MTGQELQQRNGKAGNLKVFQITDGQYMVESSKGKICYKVTSQNGTKLCSCADYTTNILKDPQFLCKHILAALNSNGDSIKVEQIQKEKPKLDERFITNIKGKDFVIYAGLLDLGHQIGIKRMSIKPIQFPTKENGMEAICESVIVSNKGDEYIEVGDANPKNVTPLVSGHILRVAATRAKARALRDLTNVGMTCLEELGGFEEPDDDASKHNRKYQAGKKTYGKTDEKPPADKPKTEAKPPVSNNTDKPSGVPNKPEPKAEAKTDKPAETAKADTAKADSKPADNTAKADETKPADKPAETQKVASPDGNGKITPAQMNAIRSIAKRRGISDEELGQRSMQVFNVDIQFLSSKDASVFIRELQQSA